MRFAARKGSIADAKASIEKSGTSKNPTRRVPALVEDCSSDLIFSSRISTTPLLCYIFCTRDRMNEVHCLSR